MVGQFDSHGCAAQIWSCGSSVGCLPGCRPAQAQPHLSVTKLSPVGRTLNPRP